MISMNNEPFVTKPSDHVSLRVVGESISVLADAERTGSYEIFLQQGPEGAGPPPHFHPWDEAYYVLEGQIDVLLGDRHITLSAGEFVHIPGGIVHNFRMRTATARFLSVASRAGASKFFAAFHHEITDPSDVGKVVAVAARHEVRLPPPPA
jgi:quercetin dioxygenase-like cupin family protein